MNPETPSAQSSLSRPAVHDAVGGLFLVLGVVSGAMGAHAMESMLEPAGLAAFKTASHYLLFMGGGLIAAGRGSQTTGLSLVVWGTLMFSGSIFFLVLGKAAGWTPAFLGPVTPLGGVLMILGWTRWTWARWQGSRR